MPTVTIPSFLVCSRSVGEGEWIADHMELEVGNAVRAANLIVERGARCACVLQVGGVDAIPTFTFKYATKGHR